MESLQIYSLVQRLREMDIELMRRLSPRVNVIPVIGKADSLTPKELKAFKKRVRLSLWLADSVKFTSDPL